MNKLTFYFFLTLLTIFNLDLSANANQINRASITEIRGDSNQVYINNNHARLRDLAWLNDRIRTQNARVELTFNTGAVGRLGTNSSLRVGSVCMNLSRGFLLVSGKMNTCTPSGSLAGVRGTVYTMLIDDFGNTKLEVLEGSVNFSNRNTGSHALVHSGESIKMSPDGNLGTVDKIDMRQYNNRLSTPEFFDFKNTLPQLDKLNNVYNQMLVNYKIPDDSMIRPSVLPKLK